MTDSGCLCTFFTLASLLGSQTARIHDANKAVVATAQDLTLHAMPLQNVATSTSTSGGWSCVFFATSSTDCHVLLHSAPLSRCNSSHALTELNSVIVRTKSVQFGAFGDKSCGLLMCYSIVQDLQLSHQVTLIPSFNSLLQQALGSHHTPSVLSCNRMLWDDSANTTWIYHLLVIINAQIHLSDAATTCERMHDVVDKCIRTLQTDTSQLGTHVLRAERTKRSNGESNSSGLNLGGMSPFTFGLLIFVVTVIPLILFLTMMYLCCVRCGCLKQQGFTSNPVLTEELDEIRVCETSEMTPMAHDRHSAGPDRRHTIEVEENSQETSMEMTTPLTPGLPLGTVDSGISVNSEHPPSGTEFSV